MTCAWRLTAVFPRTRSIFSQSRSQDVTFILTPVVCCVCLHILVYLFRVLCEVRWLIRISMIKTQPTSCHLDFSISPHFPASLHSMSHSDCCERSAIDRMLLQLKVIKYSNSTAGLHAFPFVSVDLWSCCAVMLFTGTFLLCVWHVDFVYVKLPCWCIENIVHMFLPDIVWE